MTKPESIEKDLESITKIQCLDGNWNYSPYMHGMTNGMILALAIVQQKDPVFLDAPDNWLHDAADKSSKVKETSL